MAKANRHPKKEIQEAIEVALKAGWRLEVGGSHCWGQLYCPLATREEHIIRIMSTPRNAVNEAKRILRFVNNCSH